MRRAGIDNVGMTAESGGAPPITTAPFRPHRRAVMAGTAVAAALTTAFVALAACASDGPSESARTGPVAVPTHATASGPLARSSAPATATIAPTTSPSYGFGGRGPVPGVDPRQIVSGLAQRWNIRFVSSDLYGAGTRKAGGGTNRAWGARQAIVLYDRDNQLRTINCRAGDPAGGPLPAEGRRFLDDCAARAFSAAEHRATLASWLDANTPRGVPETPTGNQPWQKRTVIGPCQVVLEYAPGLVAVEIYATG
jgi:hypothetical protein